MKNYPGLISRRRIPSFASFSGNTSNHLPATRPITVDGLVLVPSDNFNNEESARELLSYRREIGVDKD